MTEKKPTAESDDDEQEEDDAGPMTTDGWYAGEVMDYKVESAEDDDPAVLAFTVTVRLHPQQKDVVIMRRQSRDRSRGE